MSDGSERTRASSVETLQGRMARTVSEITDSSSSDADDDRGIMERPTKIRRLSLAIRGWSEGPSRRWANEEGEGDSGGSEDVSDDEPDESDPEGSDHDEFDDDEFDDNGFGNDDDEFMYEGVDELNQLTLTQIRQADPHVKSVVIRRFSEAIDWAEAGRSVGASPPLKKLTVLGESMNWKGDLHTLDKFAQFCAGLVRGGSVDRLSLRQCNLDGPAALPAVAGLAPLFESPSLRGLEMSSCNVGDEIARLLSAALSRRRGRGDEGSSALRCLNLDANVIGDEAGRDLVDALRRGCDDLRKLSLGDNEIGGGGCVALAGLLSTHANLKELNLENNQIDDEGITVIANALAKNESLRSLSLSFNCSITQAGWKTFSRCLGNSSCALERLDLSSTNVTDEGAIALGGALAKNTSLKALNMYDLSSEGTPLVTGVGWRGFFACLRSPGSALERIDLRYSSVDEGGLAALAEALAGNSKVKTLDLSHNALIAAPAWRSFFACLDRPGLVLEELCLRDNNVTDKEVVYLTKALARNKTLKVLDLGDGSSVTDAGWARFSDLLCDASSIDGIRASNHALHCLGDGDVPDYLEDLLESNERGDAGAAAREKIVHYHFRNGERNVHELVGMETRVLPDAVSWIGRDGAGAAVVYQLLRSLPSLFASAGTSGGKRKRIVS